MEKAQEREKLGVSMGSTTAERNQAAPPDIGMLQQGSTNSNFICQGSNSYHFNMYTNKLVDYFKIFDYIKVVLLPLPSQVKAQSLAWRALLSVLVLLLLRRPPQPSEPI